MGNSAKMVNRIALRQRSYVKCVGEAVSPLLLPIVSLMADIKEAVSIFVHGAMPFPTPGLVVDAEFRVEPDFVGCVGAVVFHTTQYTRFLEQGKAAGRVVLEHMEDNERTTG